MTHDLVTLERVSKRFSRRQDLVARTLTRAGLSRRPPTVHAVDGVDLSLRKSEVLGLVGESGCGKSTLGRIVADIHEPSGGRVLVDGQDRAGLDAQERRAAKLKVQMIFQDPYSSLNPRMRVETMVGEAPRVHGMVSRRDADGYVDEQLQRAGLNPAFRRRYINQFSGGQRQRIGIARALAAQPQLLVCDEAVASLDVSIQAQILNLFMDLRETLDLTYLFISHDLGVVRHLSDRVAIMYLGRIVEEAPAEAIFARPNHPYTQALLDEIPRLDQRHRTFSVIKGELPSPLNPPSGCHFHPRCPRAMPRCAVESPVLREVEPGHRSACHLNDAEPAVPRTPEVATLA